MVDICHIVVLNTCISCETVLLIAGIFLSFSTTIYGRYLSHSDTKYMDFM